jgi:hypothetical protein
MNHDHRATLSRAIAAALLLALLAAALFGLGASGLLLVLGLLRDDYTAAADTRGLAARTGSFAIAGAACVALLWRWRAWPEAAPQEPQPWTSRDAALLAFVLALGALASLPNLNDYPFAAPDETHHLIVARNLAQYGAYASGHPDTGLNYFDDYDSVGPTLIVPAAAAFKLFGVSLAAARAVVSLYFLGLLAVVFLWVRRHAGTNVAGFAAVGVLLAYSSFYLSRTFYGEVPALFFLVAGLMLWERARGVPAHAAAGLLLGCCVLTKPIFIIVACCGAAALFFALVRGDTLRWRGLAALVAGIVFPVVLWSWVQSMGQTEQRSMLGIYQHYLLFGIAPIGRNLLWLLLDAPLGNAVYAALALLGGGLLVARRASPAALTLWLLAPFFAQWWLAYTPGQLPRYLWPCYVVSGIAWGVAMARFLSTPGNRALRFAALTLLVLPPALWLRVQLPELATNREMRATQELAAWLEANAPQESLATDDYTLRGALVFLTGRPIGGNADLHTLLAGHDLVAVRRATLAADPGGEVRQVIGEFAVLSRSAP